MKLQCVITFLLIQFFFHLNFKIFDFLSSKQNTFKRIMEEAGPEEGLCDSVLVAVSTMDKAKMCPEEELKGKVCHGKLSPF